MQRYIYTLNDEKTEYEQALRALILAGVPREEAERRLNLIYGNQEEE